MTFKEWITGKEIKKISNQNNLDIKDLDLKQIVNGFKVELEHGTSRPKTDVTHDNSLKTLKIALAHLYEDPNYYKKLKTIHKES